MFRRWASKMSEHLYFNRVLTIILIVTVFFVRYFVRLLAIFPNNNRNLQCFDIFSWILTFHLWTTLRRLKSTDFLHFARLQLEVYWWTIAIQVVEFREIFQKFEIFGKECVFGIFQTQPKVAIYVILQKVLLPSISPFKLLFQFNTI